MKKTLLILLLGLWSGARGGEISPVRDTVGVVRSEFVYDRVEFPSCHAATIVETSRGELMIALFGGKYESNADCSIWASHLGPKGWTPPRMVVDGVVDSVKTACWNPVLFQIPGGDLLLFYKVGTCVQEWSGWLVRSSDGGHAWSAPERLPEGILGPIKNKPILWGDRLLCGSSLERGGWRSYLEITDPGVRRWRTVGPLNNRKQAVQIIQPSLLRHADGTLQAICRSIDLRGTIVSVFSHDGGETWDEPCSTGLPNNDSGLDAVALRDGRFLLVYNHIQARRSGAASRSPLNVALSDNGRDWYAALVLEDSPGEEFSYPSVIQSSDGLVHIVYTWHRACIKHVVLDPSRLRIDPSRRIVDEEWIDDPATIRRLERGRADTLIGRMSFDERCGLLGGRWRPHDRGTHELFLGGVERLGIPDLKLEYLLQGVHTNGKSTRYPAPLALAATFDTVLIRRVGQSLACDGRARGIQAAIAPEVTLYDASCEESRSATFGDQADHVAACARALAAGLASEGVMPIGRLRLSDATPTDDQREVLRRVTAGHVLGGLMLRGERNGVRAVEDSLTNEGFLRRACGFEGLLLAEPGEIRDTRASFRGGMDVDLPRGEWFCASKLGPLVDSGEIVPAAIDDRVRRQLLIRRRFGLEGASKPDLSIPENRAESRAVALEAARRSLVLLRNEERLLPLRAGRGTILVLGNRLWRNSAGEGPSSVYAFDETTLGEALRGVEGFDLLPAGREYIDLTLPGTFFSDAAGRLPSVRAEYFDNDAWEGEPLVRRIEPRIDYAWGGHPPVEGVTTGRFSIRWSGVYRPMREEVLRLSVAGQGRYSLRIDDREVLRCDDPAQLSPQYFLLRAEAGRCYRFELCFAAADEAPDIQLACTPLATGDLDERMRQASKIVVSVGSNGDLDAESRFWLEQARPYAAKTIVVMQSCDLRDLAWSRTFGAAVLAWHTGQQAGQAIADLLLGRILPSGRMPLKTPFYPFGYGLSDFRKRSR
ncbi:exo-alpha-sialidase [uncultured Alistipes sp.]|uniref:exo-alpha-sialidase n=1 Tax=uncultured Alistipes sp. TaxID=538949 RepID=UPI002805B79F|nr:exo-alpha-sialidase [uncultured Alistipes sp.]